MSWAWIKDGEPVTDYDLGQVQTAEVETLTVELWWHRDTPEAEPAEDVQVQTSTEDPTRPGVYSQRERGIGTYMKGGNRTGVRLVRSDWND